MGQPKNKTPPRKAGKPKVRTRIPTLQQQVNSLRTALINMAGELETLKQDVRTRSNHSTAQYNMVCNNLRHTNKRISELTAPGESV